MTLKLTVTDGGRETVSLAWSREVTDPGIPSSYVVHRCIPPAPMERIAAVTSGRKFIDPNCRPSTTYVYRVAAIGLLAPEDDLITVTTRPATEYPNHVEFFTHTCPGFSRGTSWDRATGGAGTGPCTPSG